MGAEQIIFGGAWFGIGPTGRHDPLSEEEMDATVAATLAAGIREFDTAPWYGAGTGEERLGRSLKRLPPEVLKDLQVTTKVGRLLSEPDGTTCGPGYDQPGRAAVTERLVRNDYTAAGAERSVKESLARLGLDSVWALRVHDPCDNSTYDGITDEVAIAAAGACVALRALRDQGVIRHVGLGMNCNKDSHQGSPDNIIRFIRSAEPGTFDSALLAGGWNLLTQAGLPCLLECEKRGIDVYIAGIYASGLLVGGATYAYIPAPQPMIEKAARWRDLAQKRGFSLPAVAVAFAMLPKVVKRAVVGLAKKKEVDDAVAYFREASQVPVSLWAEAKDLGLLGAEVPIPHADLELDDADEDGPGAQAYAAKRRRMA